MKKIFLFILFSLLKNFISSQIQDQNKTSSNSSESKEDNIDYIEKLNITIDEMDKMLLCSIFIQKGLSKDKDRIEALINKTNIPEPDHYLVFDKIGSDIFEKCYRDIDMKTVRKYFYNLSSVGSLDWDKKYDKYVEIDYDKYLNESNFNLTEEQKLLSIKFSAIKQRLTEKQKEDQEKKEKIKEEQYKIKIGNFDLDNIPDNIKGFFFVLVFAAIFIGAIYLLKTLVNKPKKVKQKKKKTQ